MSDVTFMWCSLLLLEVGIGICFASQIMVIPSQLDYLELECPHCQK